MELSRRAKINLLFFIMMMLCFQIQVKAQDNHPGHKEIPVGVILDMGSWVGKTVHSCISMAVSDFYTTNVHYKTRIVLQSRNTHGEALHALSAALDLLDKSKVQAIIGSESTTEAKFLAVLGDEARVPILSLSPNPSYNNHPYFLQITQDETTQFKAIAAMAESFKWKNLILIGEDTANGRYMATFMTNVFQQKSLTITYSSLISISASSEVVYEELHKLATTETKNFVIHASHSLSSQIFLNAKYLGMMGAGYKWIVTSKTMNFVSFIDDEVIESMQGVVGYKSYIPQSMDLHKFTLKWRKEYNVKEINVYAIWAYDVVSALAMAVERTHKNTNDLETTGSTQSGTALLNQMLRISFDGLGGAFQFMNGRVISQVLEIVNVIGKEERKVGFWTTDDAFTKKICMLNSFSDNGLEPIVWAGGIQTNPTHRMLQLRNKVLKIAIPVKFRSGRLFNVSVDPQTNKIVVSGFCVEVFLASFEALTRDVAFEFIPVSHGHVGTINYNDLIDLVHAGVYDAAIGDITITANRSLYVDFTFSFTDLGLATLYRNTDASMWIFMEPLSTDLWLVSAGFFILLGFVIWILERRTNEEFQGSPAQQIGTTFWFAFSTIVYAHRQKLENNLSRFVVTVWLFVVLVLVSSYTATLSSLLTVEQIQLASKRGSIGYQVGTPVKGIIVRNVNFKDTRLKPYTSYQDYAMALSLGDKNGGVDAIVDEIPYIREFLAEYPSGYSMTVSDATTNGFGFVFPRGSSLASELSSQIARLREDGTLKELENKWFNQQEDPQSKDSASAPKILNFKGLRGLFLISGVSMAAAIFIFMIYFVHEKLHFTYTMLAGGNLSFILRFLAPKGPIAVERK